MSRKENTIRKSYRRRKILSRFMPLLALLLLFLSFLLAVEKKGYRTDLYLKIIFNETAVLAVVATGAIFIFTLGSFDISLGAATLFSATLGILTYMESQSVFLMIFVIFISGILCSLTSSLLASFFRIPAFVTTVAMMSVLTAVSTQIITSRGGALGGISIPSGLLKPLDTPYFKLLLMALYIGIAVFIFNFTKIGRRQKFIGANPLCAKLTGIRASRYTIIAFAMAGLGVGLGAFLTLIYTPSVTSGTAGSIGMNIIVAIVFGGMPISGGADSKIYAALIGGFSYTLLNNTLKILIEGNAGYGISQMVSALFFLLLVFITSMNYRSEQLPR